MIQYIDMNDIVRFIEKVNFTETCWLWTAHCSPTGYGRFSLNSKTQYAHRVAYTWFIKEIPEGMELDHINPDEKVSHRVFLWPEVKKLIALQQGHHRYHLLV